VKPSDGRYRSATQVNVSSPEIIDDREADSVHMLEGRMLHLAKGERCLSSRGLSQCYDIARKRQELGRAYLLIVRSDVERRKLKKQALSEGKRQSDSIIVAKKPVKADGAKERISKRSGEERHDPTSGKKEP